MDWLEKGAKLIIETCAKVKPGETVLLIADDETFPLKMGKLAMDAVSAIGAEPVMAVIKPREIGGHEPPLAVAVAMRSVNVAIHFTNRHGIGHTDARKDATAAGVRVYVMVEAPEDYFNR